MESSKLRKIVEYTSIPVISVIILLLFSIFSSALEPFTILITLILIDFILFLAILHFYSNDLSHGRWKRKLRKLFRRKLFIAIIREEDCKKVKSRFEPEDWERFLGDDYNYEYITTFNLSDISDKFDAIINPYGECYPEKDILEKISFKRIKEYVKTGGIFVSVAGCPFWFNWNKLSLGNPSTAKEVYSYAGVIKAKGDVDEGGDMDIEGKLGLQHVYSPKPIQSLTETLTFDELGVLTTTGQIILRQVRQSNEPNDKDVDFFGDLVNIGETNLVFEFRAIRNPVQSCIPILRSEMVIINEFQQKEYLEIYPLSSVLCGEGHFIFTGMHMDVNCKTPIIIFDENDDTIIDEDNKVIPVYLLDEDAHEIINAQAQKVCQALRNLLDNRDRIKAYVTEKQ